MAAADDWTKIIPVDTSDDVHVATPGDGVYVFYTEAEDEFVRTDCAVDVRVCR